jgi:putative tryptophan/tyrosine transport system substrate-binding protein
MLAALPLAVAARAVAQPAADKILRIGWLAPWRRVESGPVAAARLRAFREGLEQLGYAEGRNVAVEYRFADDRVERLPKLAAELVDLRVDLIVAVGPTALRAAKSVTSTIPIVAVDLETDPVAAGFVRSLGRPGSNITGLFLDQADMTGKLVQLVKEVLPGATRVAVMWDSATPSFQLKAIERASRNLGVATQTLSVHDPNDFEGAFASAAREGANAVVLLSSPLLAPRYGALLSSLALAKRLPTISLFDENAREGCLMSYGPSIGDMFGSLGAFAGKVLNGAKPESTPIERPTRFTLVINLNTAKALHITIPKSLLLRADEVIQ